MATTKTMGSSPSTTLSARTAAIDSGLRQRKSPTMERQ